VGVVVKFGRNAVAKFEKENPPYEFERLGDDEVEELFSLSQHDYDLVVDANATATRNSNNTCYNRGRRNEKERRDIVRVGRAF